jgi:hypothetical protein
MAAEIVPIIAGLAGLIAGAAKYGLDFLHSRKATATKITIGNQSVQLTGPMDKEELASLIEVLQNTAESRRARVAEGPINKPV